MQQGSHWHGELGAPSSSSSWSSCTSVGILFVQPVQNFCGLHPQVQTYLLSTSTARLQASVLWLSGGHRRRRRKKAANPPAAKRQRLGSGALVATRANQAEAAAAEAKRRRRRQLMSIQHRH